MTTHDPVGSPALQAPGFQVDTDPKAPSARGVGPVAQKSVLSHRSSNSGQQGVWVFEIGGPDTASGVVSSDVILRPDDGEDYDDDEDYDSVTSLGPEDLGTTPIPHETPRRGDTSTTRHRVLSPSRPATARPARPPTERTRSFQLPGARFPQQHPQVIDVDEVEESEVGKAAAVAVRIL
ncbi:Nidogen-1 [Myotis brandtii]|uniref:Nidogen-1 n=1 Tax=Myotis brandtii TaxID=109478 RepID=S7QGN9_MYOBR|nr:Nidogen-1 [Myotis brandtii]